MFFVDHQTIATGQRSFHPKKASMQNSLVGFSSVMEGVEKSKLRSGIRPLNAVAADLAASRISKANTNPSEIQNSRGIYHTEMQAKFNFLHVILVVYHGFRDLS